MVLGEAAAQQRVEFDSLDTVAGRPVPLIGYWFAAAGSPQAPAALLLHGCGGAYSARGTLDARMREYTSLLNSRGVSALVLDSLSPRGERELCTQRIGTRRVTQANRRLDALAAVEWLAQRPDVNAASIGLVGWSHGGSTLLAAINARHPAVAVAPRRPAFAVAFYPGCEAEARRGFETQTPLLLLVGEADDWTPVAPCRELAGRASGVTPQLVSYPGAYHGFDSTTPLRRRDDVPNGVRPGEGVHVGGDPQARVESREAMMRFIEQSLRR